MKKQFKYRLRRTIFYIMFLAIYDSMFIYALINL